MTSLLALIAALLFILVVLLATPQEDRWAVLRIVAGLYLLRLIGPFVLLFVYHRWGWLLFGVLCVGYIYALRRDAAKTKTNPDHTTSVREVINHPSRAFQVTLFALLVVVVAVIVGCVVLAVLL